MAKKKDEKDVLVVKKGERGGAGARGRRRRGGEGGRGRGHPSAPRKSGERAEFPAIRPTWRRAGQLLQELLPAVQGTQPLRFLPHCGRPS